MTDDILTPEQLAEIAERAESDKDVLNAFRCIVYLNRHRTKEFYRVGRIKQTWPGLTTYSHKQVVVYQSYDDDPRKCVVEKPNRLSAELWSAASGLVTWGCTVNVPTHYIEDVNTDIPRLLSDRAALVARHAEAERMYSIASQDAASRIRALGLTVESLVDKDIASLASRLATAETECERLETEAEFYFRIAGQPAIDRAKEFERLNPPRRQSLSDESQKTKGTP